MEILAEIRTKRLMSRYGGSKLLKQKQVYLLFSVMLSPLPPPFPHHPSPTMGTLSLISVLNADMKFFPHLLQPKGIGQQDTVSLQQQKTR